MKRERRGPDCETFCTDVLVTVLMAKPAELTAVGTSVAPDGPGAVVLASLTAGDKVDTLITSPDALPSLMHILEESVGCWKP
jgi:hypothetical protein